MNQRLTLTYSNQVQAKQTKQSNNSMLSTFNKFKLITCDNLLLQRIRSIAEVRQQYPWSRDCPKANNQTDGIH
eukprot:13262308-Ditylum_brightwellii.AAC.1